MMYGFFLKELIHLTILTHLTFRSLRLFLPTAFPGPLNPPDSTGHVAFTTLQVLFGCPTTLAASLPTSLSAYRVAYPSATREPQESSRGHALIFPAVQSARTLVRWVDEMRLRPTKAGSTLPHLWPTGSSKGWLPRLQPGSSPHALRIPLRSGHPALRVVFRPNVRRRPIPLSVAAVSGFVPA